MLQSIINYFFSNRDPTITVTLQPSQKFFDGYAYLSILELQGEEFFLPENYHITHIKYQPIDHISSPYPYYFTINYEKFNISPGLSNELEITNKVVEKDLNILCNNNKQYVVMSMCYKHLNPLPSLPLTDIPRFNIILTLEKKSNSESSSSLLTVNTYAYNNISPPLQIENQLFSNKKNIE